MFIFGALSPGGNPSERLAPNMETRLASWLKRIRRHANIQVCSSTERFLAGQCGVVGSFGAKWFFSRRFADDGLKLYIQVHGHPSCVSALSDLLPKFGAFDDQLEYIVSALRSIFTEFCCVVYDERCEALYIVTDKLGIVPVYIYRHQNQVFYSTALWVLKLLVHFKGELNWQGIAEQLFFVSPIGDRTMYRSVSRIVGGTVVRHAVSTNQHSYYKLWNAYSTNDTAEDLPILLARNFNTAVSDRTTSRQTEYSTLSGGLDSRTVVASLAKQGKKITTFNFMSDQMLDSHLSEMFAKYIGADHYHHPVLGLSFPNFSLLSRTFLDQLLSNTTDEPIPVWTGDDGSISIGFVYMRRRLLNKLDSLKYDRLPEHVIDAAHIPPRPFKRGRYNELRELALDGLRQFFDMVNVDEHAVKYYCFLMLNRVPRMFDNHYETAHLHRILNCSPFLDVRTIEPVLSVDMPQASEHRLYHEFAYEVSPKILEVPWQAYPGHEPCPLPLPKARDQWQPREAREEKLMRAASRESILKIMKSSIWRSVVRNEILAAYLLLDFLCSTSRCSVSKPFRAILDSHEFRG